MTYYAIQQKSTGLFLRMSKFEPGTDKPVVGPIEQSWFPSHDGLPFERRDEYCRQAAITQAVFLGEDWQVVNYEVKEVKPCA